MGDMTAVQPEHQASSTGQRLLVIASLFWAIVGWVVALWPVDNSSGPVLIAAAIGFPFLAAVGGWFAWRQANGWAAGFLFVSVGTPTYFLWPLLLLPIGLTTLALKLKAHDGPEA